MFLFFLASVAQAANPSFKTIHINDLEGQLKGGNPAPVIYDVNVESTRANVGVIPGAKLLSSSSDFDVKKELPLDQNKSLVFYCANTQCTASHTAAERAIKFGFKNVSVMVEGIYGWRDAGKPLQKIKNSGASTDPKSIAGLTDLKSAVIVDVRENEERHEVIPGALWFPMSKVNDSAAWSEFKKGLPKEKTIAFHCARGARAKVAAEKLAGEGYRTLFFKSTDEWSAAGLKLEKGPAK